MFDEVDFTRPSTAQGLEPVPLEGGSQISDDDALAKQSFEDALSRIVCGSATSAAGGAASPEQESLDFCDKYYESLLDRPMQENKKTPLTPTLVGVKLVEVVTREIQLIPEQVASMTIPILPEGTFDPFQNTFSFFWQPCFMCNLNTHTHTHTQC